MKTLEQEIENFKNSSITAAKEIMYENDGKMNPFMTVLALENGKYKTGVLPVPKEMLADPRALAMALPTLITILQLKEQTEVKAFSFIAHANMAVIHKDPDAPEPTEEEVKNTKKKDVLITYLSTPGKNFCPLYIYEVTKTGKKVNKYGDLVDEFELIEDLTTMTKINEDGSAKETSPFSEVWTNVEKLLKNEEN